jgi:hypothetical protein
VRKKVVGLRTRCMRLHKVVLSHSRASTRRAGMQCGAHLRL